MKLKPFIILGLAVGLVVLLAAPAQAEQHRATRLGSPATRFAPPLVTSADLRARFRDEKLRPDFASVLRQWGWKGSADDLHRAALTHEITEVKIPVGATMPFMSSREAGKPICLRNVLWAGQEPISAFAFTFSSNGRRYRCVTPKPCSNFFLEDLGPEPKAALALECSAPAEVLAGRPAEICLTVRNTGNVLEPKTVVTLPIPQGATVTRATENAAPIEGRLAWEILNLAPDASMKVCAVLAMREPGVLSFTSTAGSAGAKPVQSTCATKVLGIPAILLEVVDLEDPIEVGKQVTYDIKVTNQGSAPGTSIRLVCTLPASQEFVSGTGDTAVRAQQSTVTMEALPILAPKAAASWRVVVKATKAADARFRVELTSEQFQKAIVEDESTEQY